MPPIPVAKVVIDATATDESKRTIGFYAFPDLAAVMQQYGTFGERHPEPDYYLLKVSRLYDFGEVLNHIRSLG